MPRALKICREMLLERVSYTRTGCWEWLGCRNGDNYGSVEVQGKVYRTHRLAAHLWLGFDLTSRMEVCHKCDNPPCFNPNHLFIATHAENMRDCKLKGRRPNLKGECHPKARLTEPDVHLIRALRAQGWAPTEIAPIFDINPMRISDITRKRIWRHI